MLEMAWSCACWLVATAILLIRLISAVLGVGGVDVFSYFRTHDAATHPDRQQTLAPDHHQAGVSVDRKP
jgi:hypothetical protein